MKHSRIAMFASIVESLALPDGTPGWAAVALDADGHLCWSYPAGSVIPAVRR